MISETSRLELIEFWDTKVRSYPENKSRAWRYQAEAETLLVESNELHFLLNRNVVLKASLVDDQVKLKHKNYLKGYLWEDLHIFAADEFDHWIKFFLVETLVQDFQKFTKVKLA